MTGSPAVRFRTLLADIVGRASPSHGYSARTIKAAESRTGARLPRPLRDYYLTVGRHKINQAHNRLLPPEDLFVAQRRLVFMVENQAVVFWAVRSRTAARDPVVFQSTDPEDEDWVADAACSQFLPAMLCWQAVAGGLPHVGYSRPMGSVVARQCMRGWPSAGRIGTLSAFARDGRVVCVDNEGATAQLYMGARSRRALHALTVELGVAVDEL